MMEAQQQAGESSIDLQELLETMETQQQIIAQQQQQINGMAVTPNSQATEGLRGRVVSAKEHAALMQVFGVALAIGMLGTATLYEKWFIPTVITEQSVIPMEDFINE